MTVLETDRITGGCLCGAAQYEVIGPAVHLCHCHCWMCRKHHGAAFATFAAYPADRFRVTAGEDLLRTYPSSPEVERRFCSICGSSLTWQHVDEPDRIWVTAGTLDDDPRRPVDEHIFVADKAPWYTITDQLRQR